MGRSKQDKFKEFSEAVNTFEYNDKSTAAKIKRLVNKQDLTLELGCGKGEYTINLAEIYPQSLFFGIDVQGERMWAGVRQAQSKQLSNAYFLRAQVEDLLDFFPEKSVEDIWINYPDPFPKDKHAKKRLTSPRFLEIYRKLLTASGVVHLKTDSPELYEYTKEQLAEFDATIIYKSRDIQKEQVDNALVYIPTNFEDKHLKANKKIHYISFQFPN